MHFLKDIYHLFYPKICHCCAEQLVASEELVCTTCLHDLPLLGITNTKKNKISALFEGKFTIVDALAFLTYEHGGKTQQLIHHLKYKGKEAIGSWLGSWFADYIIQQEFLKDIDAIVPVPLHPKKERKRGYNQVSAFGKILSEKLHKPYIENSLIRTSQTETQTHKNKWERFENNNSKFRLNTHSWFEGQHLLLIDDVITTGATLLSCCAAFEEVKDCKISIASLAFTE